MTEQNEQQGVQTDELDEQTREPATDVPPVPGGRWPDHEVPPPDPPQL
jgi:hypothetical protein